MINVTVENKELAKPQYPCLMVSEANPSLVVLFTSDNCGTVVKVNANGTTTYYLGEVGDDWSMSAFKPFTKKLILENAQND